MFNIVLGYLADQRSFQTFGAATSLLVTANPADLFTLNVCNSGTGAFWVQVFNEATSGATGTPVAYPCSASGYLSITNMKCGIGIFARAVTTATGITAAATGTVQFDAYYMNTRFV
jgi:hypothetical protein